MITARHQSLSAGRIEWDTDELPTEESKPDQLRFTRDGSHALENHLAHVCRQVKAGVRRIIPAPVLQGIALGGGYGRGEGGVLRCDGGEQLYNDLDFFVFVRSPVLLHERRHTAALHRLGVGLTPVAGVDVEFKLISLAQVWRNSNNMAYYDLLTGHRWLLGDDRLFKDCQSRDSAADLPISEATRLMMNRCSGLLFAREKLAQKIFAPADADFVCRNLAKLQLALGDAMLIAWGRYHWSCVERHQRLLKLPPDESFPGFSRIREHHAIGVDFKLHPYRSQASRTELQAQLREISAVALQVWLWLESRRLGRRFDSPIDYAASPANKWPKTSWWRNCLSNVKMFGPMVAMRMLNIRHPRERVLNALALMLWAGEDASAKMKSEIRRALRAPAEERNLLPIYRSRWAQIN